MTSSRKHSDNQLQTTICTEEAVGESPKLMLVSTPKQFLLSEGSECELYMMHKNFYKKYEVFYPWLEILAFKAPVRQKSVRSEGLLGVKSQNYKTSKFNKNSDTQTKDTKSVCHQPFIFVMNKANDYNVQEAFDSIHEHERRIMVYLHDNGADIGAVLGHCTDLSSQLGCDVLIPELSGFGGYNSNTRGTTEKKTLINSWVLDAKNAFRIAKDALGTRSYQNIIVYAKGMSTSIVLKTLESEKLKNIIFESSLYTKHRSDLLVDTIKCIQNADLPRVKLENSIISSDSAPSPTLDRQSSYLLDTVPRLLILESNNYRQRVHSNDIITTFLSKLHNVKNQKPSVRLSTLNESYSRTLLQKGEQTTDDLYSGCIRYIAFAKQGHPDFKKDHRKQYISALKWMYYL